MSNMNSQPELLRVVLVGREAPGVSGAPGASTVESRLRRDAGIELVRAREPLDAIGELARPMAMDGVTALAVVTLPEALASRDEADFAAAVRRVSPTARVFGLNGQQAEVSALTPDSLRAMLAAAPTPEHASVSAPAAADDRAPAQPAASADDAPIIRALLTGADLVPACLEALRRRLGDPTAAFIPPEGEPPETEPMNPTAPSAPPGTRITKVEHRGVSLGSLQTSTRVSPRTAAEGAAWLALWLVLRDQQAQLRHAAFTDPLTGVWNRRYFDRYLARALDDARARRHELSLLVFDVDNFKQFNDRHGHAAGDEILIETVRLLRSVVRPEDRVCRIGGDEFAVIFYEPSGPRDPASRHPASLSEIAERFQRQIAAQRFPKLGAHAPGVLSISGGMATFPWDASDAESLVARADTLAMESKALGKNTIKFGVGRPAGPAV